MLPIDLRAALNNNIDADITARPAPTAANLAPDIAAAATPRTVNAPANEINPLAISSHDKLPRPFTAGTIRLIAAAITTIAAEVVSIPVAPLANFVNAANSNNKAPTLARPLTKPGISILPNFSTAFWNTSIDAAINNIPALLAKPNLLAAVSFINNPNSARVAATPSKP